MKKLKTIATWIGILTYLVLSIAFVDKREDHLLCNGIDVVISDSIRTAFIAENDIIQLLDKNDFDIRGVELNSINTRELELVVNELPAVKRADVYKTIDGKLKIEINQREPILRLIDNQGKEVYIDSEGFFMPISGKHTSHVLVVNGHIPPLDYTNGGSVYGISDDDDNNEKGRFIYGIYRLALFIHTNPFWKAQFVQLYVDENKEVELIPRVGAHIIQLGKIDDYEYKLFKLKALYFKGFNAMGWNNYEIINLKYSNQVICTKR